MKITSELRASDLELDKIPGFWVFTYWYDDTVALRLKIEHTSWMDPDRMLCELRTAPALEFALIGEPFWASAWGLLHLDEHPEELDGFPTSYRREFLAMAQTWAGLSEHMEVGGTYSARYQFEPDSSADTYCLPESRPA